MARTVTQIYDALIAEKNSMATLSALQPNIDSSQTLLTNLSSPSKVAIWRLWLFLTAVAMWTLEKMWDLFKIEIDNAAAASIAGTSKWYQDQCYKFQIGYTLQYINNKYQYNTIDTNAQIVARAACVDSGGKLIVKVAKVVAGNLQPLNSLELIAFKSYFNTIKFAGTQVLYISDVADKCKLYYDIYYDALIPLTTLQPLVETTVNDYLKNLKFNGEFVITELTDKIQAVTGVINPVFLSAATKYAAIPYSPVTVKYLSNAGYLEVDPAFPLNVTFNYIPNV